MRVTHGAASTVALAALVAFASACASGSRTSESPNAGDGAPNQSASAFKVLTVGRMREPAYIEGFIGGVSSAGEVRDFVHNYHSTGAAALLDQMTSVDTPDPLTYVVHWSRADARALQAQGLVPLPRHLLESLYINDKPNFINSARFTNEWVGLGAYKLARWEPGSHMELERFDDYFLGRPPLNRVVIRFFFDANTLSAAMLGEGVDVAIPGGIDLDGAVAIRDRWVGTSHLVRIEPIPRITDMEIQFRPELARPVNGLRDRTVRQAFYQAINREELSDVMTLGLGAVADSWFMPNDPARPAVEALIPKYPHDPAAAQRLLAQAGWTRSADGILVHQPSGERFEAELRTIPQYGVKPAAVIANNWKAIGADISIWAIPQARASERELNASQTFAKVNGSYLDALFDRLDSRHIASAANRWTGRNLSAWGNPRYDGILDGLAVTIDSRERFELLKEQTLIVMGDLARYPLYWEPRPVLALKTVKADLYPYNTTWNVFEWDKQG